MHDLARMESSHSQLAEKYGLTPPGVTLFARRHRFAIEQIKEKIEGDLHQLWIADKEKRLAEYQQDVEDINSVLELNEEGYWQIEDPMSYMKVKHSAMKSAAEELGQLPAKTVVQVAHTEINYSVEGVDMSYLTDKKQ
jgi:hypothetical protein